MRKPNRWPILLSAIIFPGVGQLMQRRWITGLFFILIFAASVGFLLMETVRPMCLNLSAAIDMADGCNADFTAPSLPRLMIAISLVGLIWFASVVSTWLGYVRRVSAWREERMEKQMTIMAQIETSQASTNNADS